MAQDFSTPATIDSFEQQWVESFSVCNDSFFGSGAAADWDDLRTFGLNATIKTPYDLFLMMNYSFFTRRALEENSNGFSRSNEVPDGDCRWDSLAIRLEYRLFSGYWPAGRFHIDTLGGMEAFGNLGGQWIQETAHSGFVNDRRIPGDYIEPGLRFFAGARIGNRHGERFVFHEYAEITSDTLLQPKLLAGIRLTDTAGTGHPEVALSTSESWRAQEDPNRQIADDYENGLLLSWGYQADFFLFYRTINLISQEGVADNTFNSFGAMGFRYPGVQKTTYQRSGNFTIIQGIPFMDRIWILFLWQPEWLFTSYPPLTNKLNLYLGTGNGWGPRAVDNNHPEMRFEDLCAGIRWQLFNTQNRWLPNLFLDTGLALRKEHLYMLGPYHAVPDHISYSLTGDLRLGIDLPFLLFRDRGVDYSIQIFYGLTPLLLNDDNIPADYNRQAEQMLNTFGFAFTYREKNLTSDSFF